MIAGPTPDAVVVSELKGSVVIMSITNNTDTDYVFRTALQWLDREGADVVPAVVGPDIAVQAGSTGAPWRADIPRLPDGYQRYVFTAYAARDGVLIVVGGDAHRHLKVRGGRIMEVDYFEFENGGPPAPPVPLPEALAPRYVRAPDEWQGMSHAQYVWPCMPDGSCSMAAACVAGQCVPCLQDAECLKDELCVLGHCVRGERVECSTRHDCGSGACMLSGYSDDPRGNGDMVASCSTASWPKGPSPEEVMAAQEASIMPAPPGPPSPAERAWELLRKR